MGAVRYEQGEAEKRRGCTGFNYSSISSFPSEHDASSPLTLSLASEMLKAPRQLKLGVRDLEAAFPLGPSYPLLSASH